LVQRCDLRKISIRDAMDGRNASRLFIAEWIALSVEPLSPFLHSSSAATYDRNPETRATALISAVRDRCTMLGLADSMVPAAIDFVRDDAIVAIAQQRNAGRLDEARAATARLMTLARGLIREYPASACSYRALSDAYDQVKKNAMRDRDDKLVEQAIVQAIDAGQRALARDPHQLAMRHNLEKLTGQLANIKARRSATDFSCPR
jgi:hypothetical protein